jgi:hypothetical protein
MEKHVVVLSTPLGKMLEKHVLAMPDMKKIKTVKQNTFFWADNDKAPAENVAAVKAAINAKTGGAVVYKVYPVFMGKVDLSLNKTEEEKKADSYFTKGKKDITEEELAKFAADNGLTA